MSTASALSAAPRSAEASSSSSSPTRPQKTGSAPNSRSSAMSMGLFTSRICPSPGVSDGETSSSPVEMTATLSRLATSTSAQPSAASAPMSWLLRRCPRLNMSCPAAASSFARMMSRPGAEGFETPIHPSP